MTTAVGKTPKSGHDRFPSCMGYVDDVFCFRHDEANKIALRFKSVNELVKQLQAVIEEIRQADLADDEDKRAIISLLEEEIEVVSFSLSARGSIVRL